MENNSNLQINSAKTTANEQTGRSNETANPSESLVSTSETYNLEQQTNTNKNKQEPQGSYSERLMMNKEVVNPYQSETNTSEDEDNLAITRTTGVKPTEVIVSSSTSCVNDAVQFSTSDRCNCSYKWDFGDNTTSQEKLPSHKYTSEGTYKVAVTVTSKETRKSVYAYRADVKIAPNPIAEFEIEQPTWNRCDNEYAFVSRSSSNYAHSWFINNQLIIKQKEMKHFFYEKGSHSIKLVTENDLGCVSEKLETIYIERDYNLGASNAFTPNGDGKRYMDAESS